MAPAFAYSTFYKNKPADFVYRQSIFYNAQYILGFSSPELESVSKNKLLINDTLEFINNEDAFVYFNKASDQIDCHICSSRTVSRTKSYADSITQIDDTLERSFSQLPVELARYLKSDLNRNVFLITKYDQSYISNFSLSGQEEDLNVSAIYSAIKQDDSLNKLLVLPGELTLDERNKLIQYFEKVQEHLPDPNETSVSRFKVVNSKFFDCQEIFPELSLCLNKHKAARVNFLSINKIQKNNGAIMNMVAPVYEYIVNCYSIDMKNNTISKYVRNLGGVSGQQILQQSLEGFAEIGKLIAKAER